jgi:hypothetical protein
MAKVTLELMTPREMKIQLFVAVNATAQMEKVLTTTLFFPSPSL